MVVGDYIKVICRHMNGNGKVYLGVDDNAIFIRVDGRDDGLLIGIPTVLLKSEVKTLIKELECLIDIDKLDVNKFKNECNDTRCIKHVNGLCIRNKICIYIDNNTPRCGNVLGKNTKGIFVTDEEWQKYIDDKEEE